MYLPGRWQMLNDRTIVSSALLDLALVTERLGDRLL
jgi:hypothetical protein